MSAIIFDFNGTMVFDSPYHDKAWKLFSEQLRGYAITDEELAQNVHGKVNEKIIEYLKPGLSVDENIRYSKEKEAYYRNISEHDENYVLVNGLQSFLNDCKKNDVLMNIASASIKDNINYFVSHFQLDRWFDANKIIYDDGHYENKVQMFIDAALQLGVSIHDCIIIEDSNSGIACAKQVQPKHLIVIKEKGLQAPYLEDEKITLVIEDFTDERIYELLK